MLRSARRGERLADAFDESTAGASPAPLRLVIAYRDEAPTLRGAAAITLARRTHEGATDAVLPLLASPSLVLRAKGCEALGDAHARTAGDAVAELLADPSLRVRLACSLALLDMRDPRGELALKQLATDPATTRLMLPHLELGGAAMRRRDYATGKAELTMAVELAPDFTDALVELAAAYAELGDSAEAKRRVQAVLAVELNFRERSSSHASSTRLHTAVRSGDFVPDDSAFSGERIRPSQRDALPRVSRACVIRPGGTCAALSAEYEGHRRIRRFGVGSVLGCWEQPDPDARDHEPRARHIAGAGPVTVTGTVTNAKQVFVNGVQVTPAADGTFSTSVDVALGYRHHREPCR